MQNNFYSYALKFYPVVELYKKIEYLISFYISMQQSIALVLLIRPDSLVSIRDRDLEVD